MSTEQSIRSVNWHLWSRCNYDCRFCYVRNFPGRLNVLENGEYILNRLKELGIEKITFVGGEPLMHPLIYELLALSKKMGFTNSVTTNGSFINEITIKKIAQFTDWVGISIDSSSEEVEKQLGRGRGHHVAQAKKAAMLVLRHGMKLKINTTVTNINFRENLTALIEELKPDRWKIFQMLHIPGQNSHCIEKLGIDDGDFARFVKKHEGILLKNGQKPVFERCEDMTGSYFMIGPQGDVIINESGKYSELSFDELTKDSLKECVNGTKYFSRGALYDW